MADADADILAVFVSAELAPHTQVGGLGEVAAALPAALRARGHDVRVFTPFHARARRALGDLPAAAEVTFDFAHRPRRFRILEHRTADGVPVLYLEAPDFFETSDDVYGADRGLLGVGHLRWLFLAAAFRPALRALSLVPDLVHVNDWHGGAIPVLDRTVGHWDEDTADCAHVLTVHNAAHQGRMARRDWRDAGLREDLLDPDAMLHDGDVDLLKAAAQFCDRLTTVSPTHARELTTPEGGFGLQGVFESRAEHLEGILNGLDGALWNPATDAEIAAPYDVDDLAGKAACRRALLAELGLDDGPGPAIAMIARLTPQKGVDLVLDALPRFDEALADWRLVVLGDGDAELAEGLRRAARREPRRVAVRIGFDVPLAHRIEAGADLFLMPSRFEPCGLNQMISQRYGTLPLVHRVGGLADTVTGADAPDARDGFVIETATVAALLEGLREADGVWSRPGDWRAAMRRAMRHDRSWARGAAAYEAVWRDALAMRARREREELLLERIPLEPVEPFLAPQRAIPTHHEIDVLRLQTVDPRRIHAYWEVQGEHGKRVLGGLSDAELWASRWELRMRELDGGGAWTVAVEGIAKSWFLEVEPHRRYRGELVLHAAGSSWVMARSNETATPPERSGGGS